MIPALFTKLRPCQEYAQYQRRLDVHVKSAIMGHGRPHQILHLLAASNIRGDEQSIAAALEDHIVRCIITTRIAVTVRCRLCVRAHHVCTLTRKPKCNRSTNPRRRTCDTKLLSANANEQHWLKILDETICQSPTLLLCYAAVHMHRCPSSLMKAPPVAVLLLESFGGDPGVAAYAR